MSIVPNSSKRSDPLRHSIQSEEVTEPIALVPNRLGYSIGPYHPRLVGIDITGHASLIIKKAFLHNRKGSLSALGVPLDVLCTQSKDYIEKVNRERCRIGLEIISVWLWEHWNAQNDYINLPEFLVFLKASDDKMTLEEAYEAAIHSMRQKRLPYSHKAFFESNYTIEAEPGD
ncbi:uncharacterized protein Bfra_005643 [Botrytis fragariae]|uniref:Uncharacterized protein n=1 Tax=Botrytis fragariae TaxID=1964551 RepID=A0A8H6ARI1_9HELO|nr:uncharacterized protein Bfra_005643 [Botrytis fragariae]KAF5872287.1 hypothetical protein Bfra_005643 [Botrytis fragariae]